MSQPVDRIGGKFSDTGPLSLWLCGLFEAPFIEGQARLVRCTEIHLRWSFLCSRLETIGKPP